MSPEYTVVRAKPALGAFLLAKVCDNKMLPQSSKLTSFIKKKEKLRYRR